MLLTMRAADRQLGLPSMARLPGNRLQQQWPAGDRLTMMLRIGQAYEQAPPVVNETNNAGEQPAALQVLRRETAPAPVALQFIKGVFAICAITIELAQSQNLAVQRTYQSGVFPSLPLASNLSKAEQRQLGMRAVENRERAIELAAQQDDPP